MSGFRLEMGDRYRYFWSIGIGKYWYFLVVSVLVSVSVTIGIFWSIGIVIGTSWIEKHSIGKNNSDPPSRVEMEPRQT